jgi:ubiquinone/menaquinone biosynthesis C-methylase UbiE
MKNIKRDTEIEMNRYNKRALQKIDFLDGQELSIWHLPPIQTYYQFIQNNINSNSKVLEIGAGTGNHSQVVLDTGAYLFATDVSKESLKVLDRRFKAYKKLQTKNMDMESIEFEDKTFDCVVSAGSLSYGDNHLVMAEIHRVLKEGGKFICLDSFHHNPIYRISRRIRVLIGQRTRSTIRNMPTIKLLTKYEQKFGKLEVNYFGSIIWLAPTLAFLFGNSRAARIINFVDRLIGVRKSAFKIVFVAQKEPKSN